jgi:proteic killer suppression protein
MIKFFAGKETEKIFHQEISRKLPLTIQDRALVKLLLIDSAISELDLLSPPANHFEYLKGKLKGYCSVRINDQWRIEFKFSYGDAFDVSIVDYH